MPLSKDELIQILGGMDESNLVKALGAVGVKVDAGNCGMDYKDGVMQEGGDSDDGLASWNATSVTAPAAQRPSLFDKNATVEKAMASVQPAQQQPAQPPQYAQPEAPDQNIAPYAAAIS
jgi:hypothetical protein